jgi:putative CocE/NonD family hydrolase
MEQAACFFNQYMRSTASPTPAHTLIYYTLGEETWKQTDTWPIPGTEMQRWYLGEGQAMTRAAPTAAAAADEYSVDFGVTTGTRNRWYTQLGGADVVYDERSAMDARMLTYTTEPLAADMVVTGHPIVSLYVASTATDGNFFVYLEDVAPDGKVTYVTEGMLRALHRTLSNDPPPYHTVYPYRSFLKKDGMPLEPGRVATLTFPLLPTSVLFRQGHRIRIAIAGADADTFERLPAEGDATIAVSRNRVEPSFVELPVVSR